MSELNESNLLTPDEMPVAFLAGIKVESGERYSCSAICHFSTEKDETFLVPLGTVIEALRFVASQGLIPPFPDEWDWNVEWKNGCSI